ncbi:type I restriction enzyme HsdR N-terminal domain-containing protein [Halomicrobium salinisoli]|uniref:type I restriction enzyme HsdR N-terminal domain-containing protein n=1 Tax=Halomicrobium salinisoli TaxID=2878391 RepID=UPI001CEFC878|nr:type I restriction enzyme HsdR N-terminal domain-containing protein [Halomicrobium salinisoli]
MDEEAVREYVAEAQSVIEASPQMDEANTKAAVLRDFIELLGWAVPTNTQLEYSVKAFGKTYRVDYALVLEGTPVAFIEAKGVDTPLSEKHRDQLAAYLKNEDVNWGILTNGEEYEFYRRRVVDSKVTVNALADARLRTLPERVSILRAFTKDAIQTGDSEKIATRINELKRARETLETEKERLALEVADLLTDSVSDVVAAPAESQAKEMIDGLVREIGREIDRDGEPPSAVEVDTGEAKSDALAANGGSGEQPFDTSGRYVIRIYDGDDAIAAVSDRTQSKAMVEVADYLIEFHGLADRIDVPWVPSRNKAIINDEPEWADADPVYKELVDGYHVDTKLSKRAKKREIERMAIECGVTVEFDGDW